MEDWDEYRRGESRVMTAIPRVTLTKWMVLSLNNGAFKLLGEPEAVRLFFDFKNKRIGLKKTEPENPHGFPLRRKTSGPHRSVHVMGFCRKYGIIPTESVTFIDLETDEAGVVALELTKAIKLGKNK